MKLKDQIELMKKTDFKFEKKLKCLGIMMMNTNYMLLQNN